MEFNEFTEFNNPEGANYDLLSSPDDIIVRDGLTNQQIEEIYERMFELIGFCEDGEHLQYGLTDEEYLHPTYETIEKLEQELGVTKRGL